MSDDDYPDRDYPWNFYFSGVALRRWAGCWATVGIGQSLQLDANLDEAVNHREIYGVLCQIHHVGTVESEDPYIFVYAAQHVMLHLLTQKESVLECIGDTKQVPAVEIYDGVLLGALDMIQAIQLSGVAFWCSGYEADRQRLISVMNNCRPEYACPKGELPPHMRHKIAFIKGLQQSQVKQITVAANTLKLPLFLKKLLLENVASASMHSLGTATPHHHRSAGRP